MRRWLTNDELEQAEKASRSLAQLHTGTTLPTQRKPTPSVKTDHHPGQHRRYPLTVDPRIFDKRWD